MSISHVTNFEKPAISPLFRIFLELVEGRCVKDGIAYLVKFARTPAICAPLCSLVFFETFVRDTTIFVNGSLCDAGSWTDRVFVSWTLALSDEGNR